MLLHFPKGGLSRRTRLRVLGKLPAILFSISLVLGSFAYGFIANQFHFFPYVQVKSAARTSGVIWNHFFGAPNLNLVGVAEIDAKDVQSHRITAVSNTSAPGKYLLIGGAWKYLEYCPEYGCLAVVLNRDGSLVHAYPFRPHELLRKIIAARPYERLFYNEIQDISPFGVVQLDDGGLVVTFQRNNSFPLGGGVARIAKDGTILWYRQDYEHHWPARLTDNRFAILTTSVRNTQLEMTDRQKFMYRLSCETMYSDDVEILDLDGKVVDRIRVFEALLDSRFRHVLYGYFNVCDPLHLNFVRPINAELAAQVPGAEAGDLLVSLHTLSAFGIVGLRDHRFKALIHGSFELQHSVQPLDGTKVVMFDNLGHDEGGKSSRVLEYDLATGKERTLFPGPQTLPGTDVFSLYMGHIDVSPDGRRAIVALTTIGEGYEFELATGRILTKFDNLQDMRQVKSIVDSPDKDKARRGELYGVYYVH